MGNINFYNADVAYTIKHKRRLKKTLQSLFNLEGKNLAQLDYILCSDEYLLKINQDFLQHDTYTDIITFCLSEKKQPVQGEIYISVERVKENASVHGATVHTELLRICFHGALHLCGYKDKTKADTIKIRAKEDFYIAFYDAVSRETRTNAL